MKQVLFSALVAIALAGAPFACAQAPPANDQFASRTLITGALPITLQGSCIDASAELDEPDHATGEFGNMASNSVWYSWTAPESGSIAVAAVNGTFDVVVAIYSGSSLGSLVLEGYADSFEIGTEVAVAVVEAGVTYAIAVDGWSDERFEVLWQGEFDLVIEPLIPLANDDFADAQVIAPELPSVIDVASTLGATAQAGEPDHAFEEYDGANSGNLASNSVWYQWTAPASGPVVASAGGDDLDSTIAVYTGDTLAELIKVSARDSFDPGGREGAKFTAVSGTVYVIAVDTYSVDGLPRLGGNFSLVLNAVAANDQFAQRLDLGGSLPVPGVDGATIGASAEAGEPDHASQSDNTASSSVWFTWTAPVAAPVCVRVVSEQTDQIVAVYTGDTLANLSEIVSADLFAAGLKRVVFQAVAGTRYQIAVDAFSRPADNGQSGFEGLFELDICEVPPNDNAADAIEITLPQTGSWTTLNASSEFEFGEPDHAYLIGQNFSSNSVWYRWTPDADATVRLGLSEFSFDAVLAVYEISAGSMIEDFNFIGVAAADNIGDGVDETVVFDAVAGQEYAIAVDVYSFDGGDAGGGPFTLDLRLAGPFDIWIAGFTGLAGVDASPAGNPSGDGVSNLLKLVLGLDPTSRLAEDPMRVNFPVLIDVGGAPALRYRIVPGNLGSGPNAIQHGGEISTELKNWIDTAPVNTVGDTWIIELDREGVDALFGRLKVTDPSA
jgi:hypothetical protein